MNYPNSGRLVSPATERLIMTSGARVLANARFVAVIVGGLTDADVEALAWPPRAGA